MKIDIMTLFPEMINAVMRESIIGRAQDKGVIEVKGKRFVIISAGPDTEFGTEDDIRSDTIATKKK